MYCRHFLLQENVNVFCYLQLTKHVIGKKLSEMGSLQDMLVAAECILFLSLKEMP
jgi:hypothetical protein